MPVGTPQNTFCAPHPKRFVPIGRISYQSEVLVSGVRVSNLVVIRQGLGTLGRCQRFWHRPGWHRDLSSAGKYEDSFG